MSPVRVTVGRDCEGGVVWSRTRRSLGSLDFGVRWPHFLPHLSVVSPVSPDLAILLPVREVLYMCSDGGREL